MAVEVLITTGAFGAIVFLVSEICLVPILLTTTTKLASILTHLKGRKGMPILVDTYRFPVWTDGLLLGERRNVLPFLARALIVIVPVYLETRLVSTERHGMKSQVLHDAFQISARHKWIDLANEKVGSFTTPSVFSNIVFDACVSVDDRGWLSASTAEVSFSPLRQINLVRCIHSTRRRLYRKLEETPPFVSHGVHVKNITVTLTWHYGFSKSFPKDAYHLYAEKHKRSFHLNTVYRFTEANVTNGNGLECVVEDFLKFIQTDNVDSDHVLSVAELYCQNRTGKTIDVYKVSVMDENRSVRNISGARPTSQNISEASGTISVRPRFLGSFQFYNEPLFNASIAFGAKLPYQLQNKLRSRLYSISNNVTVQIPDGTVKRMTLIDDTTIFVSLVAVALLLLFAICTLLISHIWFSDAPSLNTLDGLSRSWAASLSRDAVQNGTEKQQPQQDIVALKFDETQDGNCIYNLTAELVEY